MSVLLIAVGALLAASGALVIGRLLVGPTLHDRLVALDTLVALIVCGIVVRAAYLGEIDDLALVVVVVLVGALSTLTVVRLLPEEEQ
jgi:multicomponent Na+:H+ antiporter subunit F